MDDIKPTPSTQRPPNIMGRLIFWFLLSALIGGGIWYFTESLWWSVPGGVVVGYGVIVALIAWSERGRDGCLPKKGPTL